MDLEVKVLHRTVQAEGIAVFDLGPVDGAELPPFDAGAHIDVHTPAGLVRPYSLCNAPGDRQCYRIAVLKEPTGRGGSLSMHDAVHEGDALRISAPKNHFPLHEHAERSLLFAGGIGITPLLSMAQRLDALGRDFVLHYATRSPERTAFASWLASCRFAARVRPHHSQTQGRMDLAAALGPPGVHPSGTHVYVCGPNEFLDAVRATAADLGWPESQVHFEYFAGAPVHTPRDRHFDVVIGSTSKVIRVAAAQSITDALREHGIDLPTSCEQGVCGTCLTGVLQGEVDHRDLYLTPDEQQRNDCLLPCCSRALSARLVLDL